MFGLDIYLYSVIGLLIEMNIEYVKELLTADALVAHGEDIADAVKSYHSLLGTINVELFIVTPKPIFNMNKILPENLKTVHGTRDIHQIIERCKDEISLASAMQTSGWPGNYVTAINMSWKSRK